jgi:hypothetical protein
MGIKGQIGQLIERHCLQAGVRKRIFDPIFHAFGVVIFFGGRLDEASFQPFLNGEEFHMLGPGRAMSCDIDHPESSFLNSKRRIDRTLAVVSLGGGLRRLYGVAGGACLERLCYFSKVHDDGPRPAISTGGSANPVLHNRSRQLLLIAS